MAGGSSGLRANAEFLRNFKQVKIRQITIGVMEFCLLTSMNHLIFAATTFMTGSTPMFPLQSIPRDLI
jgi:hypothetical protein